MTLDVSCSVDGPPQRDPNEPNSQGSGRADRGPPGEMTLARARPGVALPCVDEHTGELVFRHKAISLLQGEIDDVPPGRAVPEPAS